MEDRLLKAEALQFSKVVRERFFDHHPLIYTKFFTLMTRSWMKRISAVRLKSHVRKLFRGHDDLICGFNRFLPNQNTKFAIGGTDKVCSSKQKILKKSPEEIMSEFDSTIEFLHKVRRRSSKDDDLYKKFVDILAAYQEHDDLNWVNQEASALFKETPELYVEFTEILANGPLRKSMYRPSVTSPIMVDKPLDQREDVTYNETDMLFHQLESAMNAIELFGEACENNPNKRIVVEDHLTVMDLRCIESVYEGSDIDVLGMLRCKPGVASSCVLRRLHKKYAELRENLE